MTYWENAAKLYAMNQQRHHKECLEYEINKFNEAMEIMSKEGRCSEFMRTVSCTQCPLRRVREIEGLSFCCDYLTPQEFRDLVNKTFPMNKIHKNVLDKIKQTIDDWPNLFDPCEDCKYGDNRRCWNECRDCCFFYPSKFEYKDEWTSNKENV